MKNVIVLNLAILFVTSLKANDMIDTLKTHIQNQATDKIIQLLNDYPEILNEQDENGSSGFLIIAYSGLDEVFTQAKALKKTYTFHEAIVCGNMEKVKNYLDQDLNLVSRYSSDGFSPVSLASFFNQAEIAKFLIEKGADLNAHATNPSKVNALHAAVAKENIDLCKFLIEHGADVNAVQMQNVTPLHSATHRGNLELVKLLVENGADIHAKMDNGDTVISIAERDGHLEVKNYLKSR